MPDIVYYVADWIVTIVVLLVLPGMVIGVGVLTFVKKRRNQKAEQERTPPEPHKIDPSALYRDSGVTNYDMAEGGDLLAGFFDSNTAPPAMSSFGNPDEVSKPNDARPSHHGGPDVDPRSDSRSDPDGDPFATFLGGGNSLVPDAGSTASRGGRESAGDPFAAFFADDTPNDVPDTKNQNSGESGDDPFAAFLTEETTSPRKDHAHPPDPHASDMQGHSDPFSAFGFEPSGVDAHDSAPPMIVLPTTGDAHESADEPFDIDSLLSGFPTKGSDAPPSPPANHVVGSVLDTSEHSSIDDIFSEPVALDDPPETSDVIAHPVLGPEVTPKRGVRPLPPQTSRLRNGGKP